MTIATRQTCLQNDTGVAVPAPVEFIGTGVVQVEFVDRLTALIGLQDAWRALAERALEANITLSPAKATAAILHLQSADRGCALLVWQSGAGTPRRLLGLFPIACSRTRWGIPVRGAESWRHFYSLSGTPLVDARHAQATIAAFVNWLKSDPKAPRFLLFTGLEKGPVFEILSDTLVARGLAVQTYGDHERAVLETNKPGDDYLRESLGKKRSKEYRRLRNRLGDLGEVGFRMRYDSGEIEEALARFLDLEKAGWKGARGTALACRDDWRDFFTETVLNLAKTDQCRIAELSLDGQVIASTILVVSQDIAWMWKIAFDEDLSRFSPGVLLVLDVTGNLIADEGIDRVDSCATPDHPMINRIWRERLGVADLLVTTRGGLVPGRLIEVLEQLRRDARKQVKAVYKKLVKETHHG